MVNKSKGDEFYTPEWLVKDFKEHYKLTNKNIYLPFDTEDSFFYKTLKEDNEVLLKKYDDFFDTPNDFLQELAKDNYQIFSNPPFSCEKKILDKLRKTDIRYSLLGFGITWGGLYKGSTDSIHYVGYIKYDNPPEIEEKYKIIRPIRTILITNDKKNEMKKSPFVYTYSKPYRGKKEIDFNNIKTFTCPDINIITIRDIVIPLKDYIYSSTNYGTFTRKDIVEEKISKKLKLFGSLN